MSATLVNGCAVPMAGPAFEIVRLGAGQKLEGYVLSASVWGYLTHWHKRGRKGFSTECTKGKATCACESEELPTRWKGYFHVLDIHRHRECFLELTPFVANKLLDNIGERKTFRGVKFKATRSKGADNGRLYVETFPYASIPADLPDERDPRPFLERLWMLVGKEDQETES